MPSGVDRQRQRRRRRHSPPDHEPAVRPSVSRTNPRRGTASRPRPLVGFDGGCRARWRSHHPIPIVGNHLRSVTQIERAPSFRGSNPYRVSPSAEGDIRERTDSGSSRRRQRQPLTVEHRFQSGQQMLELGAVHLPGMWVPGKHRRSWLRGDLLAEVTVAGYLVPQGWQGVRLHTQGAGDRTRSSPPYGRRSWRSTLRLGRSRVGLNYPLGPWCQEARVPSSMIIDDECARCH